MSASPSAATSRPFVFDTRKALRSFLNHLSDFSKLSGVTPASRLGVQPAPEMVTSGIREIDALTGGFPRGCLTEIFGPASSGRTSLLLAALAAATKRGEVCALVDASDILDPLSAAVAGVDLDKLLWVRCGNAQKNQSSPRRHRDREESLTRTSFRNSLWKGTASAVPLKRLNSGALASAGAHTDYNVLDQVLRITDLLLQSNGFGLIALDLGDISTRAARRIPLASWFRFRRAIEVTSTVLLVIEQQPIAGSCSSLLLRLQALGFRPQEKKLSAGRSQLSDNHLRSHTRLLETLRIIAELERTRLGRTPPRNPRTILTTQPSWNMSCNHWPVTHDMKPAV